jgi:hypothetical protein
MNRPAQLARIQKQAFDLFVKKNADYGDAFATYGAVGVIVRMGDKISRLSSISNTNITLVNDESLRDTLMDLHNYSAMALMLLDEKELANPSSSSSSTSATAMSTPSQVVSSLTHHKQNHETAQTQSVTDKYHVDQSFYMQHGDSHSLLDSNTH